MAETMSDGDARYALDLVRAICDRVGPGLPGSAQERARAGMIQRELEAHLGKGSVASEDFSLAPGAFLSVYPISAVLMTLVALLNLSAGRLVGVSAWIPSAAALLLSALALGLVVVEFFLGAELLDPLLPKVQSVNVIGRLRRPGTQSVTRLLVLSGHHDSAWENTWLGLLGDLRRRLIPQEEQRVSAREGAWLRRLGALFMIASLTWLLGMILLLGSCALQLAGMMAGSAGLARAGTLGWGWWVYPLAPAVVFALFFNRGRKNGGTVPGAADNLSASALVAAMARTLAAHPENIPVDTEIRFISFGSEEAGLRGSRRYVERHRDELERLDARMLNFETIAHPVLTVLTSDGSGMVKNDPQLVQGVAAAAERAGVPYKLASASPGVANDSAPFSKAGLKALTLLGMQMPQAMVAFYHQKTDRPEVLTVEPLLNTLKVALEWARCGGE